ncbi:MAG: hypothetical protein IPK17_37370 [Chloroflexi bacterium]|uniref:hypothetical protein n=1 Tax=Candidatus Flexifilum breve TaxID=3140694 RepID=UPI00313508C8|nr:hypothetical protein [Chloroflexota bacterium]
MWTDRPAHLPAQAWTTETTHRDAQQAGCRSTQSRASPSTTCLRFTGTSGDPAGRVLHLPPVRPRRAGRRARTLAGGAPIEPTTWIRASSADVALIKALGVRETGMLALASDHHTFHKFEAGGRNQAAHDPSGCGADQR